MDSFLTGEELLEAWDMLSSGNGKWGEVVDLGRLEWIGIWLLTRELSKVEVTFIRRKNFWGISEIGLKYPLIVFCRITFPPNEVELVSGWSMMTYDLLDLIFFFIID